MFESREVPGSGKFFMMRSIGSFSTNGGADRGRAGLAVQVAGSEDGAGNGPGPDWVQINLLYWMQGPLTGFIARRADGGYKRSPGV